MLIVWLILFALFAGWANDFVDICRQLLTWGCDDGRLRRNANQNIRNRAPAGLRGFASDWASDQRAFKNVSWGKAMMWIFLLSDTFVFGCFLLAYMTRPHVDDCPLAQSQRGLCADYRRNRRSR